MQLDILGLQNSEAPTLVLGAGVFALKIGSFTLGGIGTATFGAIMLNAILRRLRAQQQDKPLARQQD